MSDLIHRILQPPAKKETLCRFLAAVLGPCVCWLTLIFLYFCARVLLDSSKDVLWNGHTILNWSRVGILFFIYIPVASLFCGLSAAFFLQSFVQIHGNEDMKQVSFWTRTLFILPFFPMFFPSAAAFFFFGFLLLAIHICLFDIAFLRAVSSFQSGRYLEYFDRWQTPNDEKFQPPSQR